jgi:hypothetical protein
MFPYIMYRFCCSLNTDPFCSYVSTIYQLTFELDNITLWRSVAASLMLQNWKNNLQSIYFIIAFYSVFG